MGEGVLLDVLNQVRSFSSLLFDSVGPGFSVVPAPRELHSKWIVLGEDSGPTEQ
jgi:hypothetical protein